MKPPRGRKNFNISTKIRLRASFTSTLGVKTILVESSKYLVYFARTLAKFRILLPYPFSFVSFTYKAPGREVVRLFQRECGEKTSNPSSFGRGPDPIDEKNHPLQRYFVLNVSLSLNNPISSIPTLHKRKCLLNLNLSRKF